MTNDEGMTTLMTKIPQDVQRHFEASSFDYSFACGAIAQWKRERRHSFVIRHSSFVIFHASKLPNKGEAGKVFTSR
jgi:hypothetical protein